MSDMKSFFGIYEGVCHDNNDPSKKYRIKVKVPQVSGGAVSNWAPACLSPITNGNHGTNLGNTKTTSASSASSTGAASPYDHTHTMAHTHTVTFEKHIYIPKVSQKVWVMFIGGDPNFPVWIGVKP